jgi:hypothetical protein
MVTKAEIDEITAYCEKRKTEEKRVYIIDRNPFGDKIAWTRRFPLIEIDRPKEVAAKTSLVYDSSAKRLWQFMNSSWRMVSPDLS